MITRYRTPDGRNLDRDHGPGPVGLMPKHVVHGWSVAEAQVRPTAVSDRKRRWEERTGRRWRPARDRKWDELRYGS